MIKDLAVIYSGLNNPGGDSHTVCVPIWDVPFLRLTVIFQTENNF